MKFAVINLGCKVNRVESDSFAATLIAQTHTMVRPEEADLIMVNTCTVTQEADKKTRKAVRHALRVNPFARVMVTGCAAALHAEDFLALDPRVEVVPKTDLPTLTDHQQLRTQEGFRTRVGLKVQDGCNNACSYCIVRVARGRAKSIPVDRVVKGACELAKANVAEIVLSGINIGSYSFEGKSLSGLIQELLLHTQTRDSKHKYGLRYRLSSIEPLDVDQALINLLVASGGRLCRHLHLPLQSGSTKVLTQMARPYTADQYRALVERLYEAVPRLSLSTDVIVGFPGESEKDFHETLKLVRSCRFAKVHVFPYSRRQGTPAAARTDQVLQAIKAERARELRKLAACLREEAYEARVGTTELALVETKGTALSESYFELPAPSGSHVGMLIPMTFQSCKQSILKT